jgi:hypothetical protein
MIVAADMEERHRGKFINHMVLKCPSIKLRVTCVCVVLIFIICLGFLCGYLKTMVLITRD